MFRDGEGTPVRRGSSHLSERCAFVHSAVFAVKDLLTVSVMLSVLTVVKTSK